MERDRGKGGKMECVLHASLKRGRRPRIGSLERAFFSSGGTGPGGGAARLHTAPGSVSNLRVKLLAPGMLCSRAP